ncbi:MAG: AraC family transcriptional regulator [Clostridia bacterium]|nr:AraC family transcriptional regulator [Clostridia bacterium]
MRYFKADSNIKRQYFVTAAILLAVLIPVYIVSYNITVENISAGIQGNIDVTMNMLDKETESLRKISMNIIDTDEYTALNKNITIDSPVEYAAVNKFAKKYNQTIDLSSIIEDSIIYFKRSDVIVSKKLTLCGEDFLSVNDFISFGGEDFYSFLDKASKEGFSETWRYCPDMLYCGKKADMLAVCVAASRNLSSNADAVIIGLIDVNNLFAAMGMDNFKSYVEYKFTAYDNSTLMESEHYDLQKSKHIISYDKTSAAVRLNLKVKPSYYNKRMRLLYILFAVYSMIIVGVGVLIVFFLAKMQSSKMHSLALAVEEFTGIANVKNDYDYISEVLKGINRQNLYLDSVVAKNVIYKLFTMTLTDDEYDIIKSKYPDLFGESIIMIIKSTNMMPEIIELGAKQYDLEIITMLKNYNGNIVVIIKAQNKSEYYAEATGKISELVSRIKEKGIDMYVSVSGICESIEKIPEKYKEAHNLLRHLEYKNIILADEDRAEKTLALTGADEKLYELIMAGNEFEASRIVYEQWYNLSENFADNSLEQLFFDQRRALLTAAENTGYKGEIVNYDSNKNIQETAFAVTDCIDKLCAHIRSLRSEKKKYDEIINYILAHYTEIDFGMTSVTSNFNVSDKTVSSVVKQKTGQSFLTYVENLRIDRAKELLENDALKVADVANMCGYGTEGAFYKAFKKKVNVSPGVYRKSRTSKFIFGDEEDGCEK